ncbi:Uncharacterized protein APZ42_006460, partial [Daphnia magna]
CIAVSAEGCVTVTKHSKHAAYIIVECQLLSNSKLVYWSNN